MTLELPPVALSRLVRWHLLAWGFVQHNPYLCIASGEIVQDYSDIVNTPQLPVLVPEGGTWQTLMDAVVVNGNQISGNSFVDDQGVTGVPDGKVLIEFDTGTPYGAPSYLLV